MINVDGYTAQNTFN